MTGISPASGYRADIDGLRALAVLPVVFGHAGLPGFSGGFVGVDIFFVISGFLITGILLREIEAGQLSILRFYERRARRILPALFAVLAACMVGGWFILAPETYNAMALSAAATLLFVSNIWFWMETGGYFATDAHLLPLLHTWSLAVEEQFYLLFPLLLWVLAARGRRVIMAAVLVLSAVSFGLSVWATTASPTANFFLTPTRVWELGLGALLALGAFPGTRSRALTETVALAGLAMILASIVLLSGDTPFPGLAALPTCLGAVAIIWSGAQRSTLVGRILSSPVPVFFGLISYSLYLWHWPLLVAARVLTASIHVPPLPAAAAIVAAIALGWLSWRFVEQPFRRPAAAGGFSGRSIVALSGAGAAALAGLAGIVILSNGFENRFPPDVLATYRVARLESPMDRACRNGNPATELCGLGTPSAAAAPAGFMLWGDSHAGALVPGFDAWLEQTGRRGVAAILTSCPPLLGVTRGAGEITRGCSAFRENVIAYLQDHPQIHTVILAAFWANSTTEKRVDALRAGLGSTIERLQAMGRRVVIIEGVPEMAYPLPDAFLQSYLVGSPLPARSRREFEQRNARVDQILDQLALSYPLTRVSMADLLCKDMCAAELEGQLLYRDISHLTEFASRHFGPMALAQIEWD